MNAPMYLLLYILTSIHIKYNYTNEISWIDCIFYLNCNCKRSNTMATIASRHNNCNYNAIEKRRKIPQWYYIFGAFCDVEGNSFLSFSYQYTTITSVELLGFFSIPCVVILSMIIFKRQFNIQHYLSILLCLIGIILLVLSDKYDNSKNNNGNSSNNNKGKNPALGDIFAVIGAIMYAFSMIFEEYAVNYNTNYKNNDTNGKHFSDCKHYQIESSNTSDIDHDEEKNNQEENDDEEEEEDLHEDVSPVVIYLRALGYFGFIICVIQGCIFDLDNLMYKNKYTIHTLLYYIGYTTCITLFYILLPIFLTYTTALVMDLSLLTANIWSLMAGIFLFKIQLNFFYYISFVVIMFGVIWHNLIPPVTSKTQNIK